MEDPKPVRDEEASRTIVARLRELFGDAVDVSTESTSGPSRRVGVLSVGRLGEPPSVEVGEVKRIDLRWTEREHEFAALIERLRSNPLPLDFGAALRSEVERIQADLLALGQRAPSVDLALSSELPSIELPSIEPAPNRAQRRKAARLKRRR